jgi:hypothetical protein
MPDVTALIPTFRRPSLLSRALSSVVEQDGAEACAAVFDNASGDETGDVVATFAARYPHVRYVCREQNIGGLANMLAAVQTVDTPYFSLLSDDDYLLPGAYRHAIAALERHPEAMFWTGVTLEVDEDGRIWNARMQRWTREGLYKPPEGALAMTHGRAPTWTGVVFRREVLDRVGFIDPRAGGPSDLDYLLRVAARFPFVFERLPAAVFTLNRQSFSATQPLSSFWPGWMRLIENMDALPGIGDAARSQLVAAVRQDAERMLFRRGANAIACRRGQFARESAAALTSYFDRRGKAGLLRVLAGACEHVGVAQRLATWTYRLLEDRIVRSRSRLQDDYGHLLRSV